jgi:stearoyl-CoA desaturase (delta-9 desaturase)
MIAAPDSSATNGDVRWTPLRSVWTGGLALVAIVGGPLSFGWDAVALFIATSGITLCFGHSLGMHRLLIHRSFKTSKAIEYLLVYLGTLVGMAGPFGMMEGHDIRDWAQRQRACHDLFGHRRPMPVDAFWQMHCSVDLKHPPRFVIEPEVANDRFYRWLERTWMWQQLPWAVLFFVLGGWPWVVWGIAVRVTVSLTGHWFVGHLAHQGSDQGWHVRDAAVQGYNVKFCGVITFGECWHANHHAFPGSARLGLEPGQSDPGWWCLKIMERLGLASAIVLPADLAYRPQVVRVRPLPATMPPRLAGIGEKFAPPMAD